MRPAPAWILAALVVAPALLSVAQAEPLALLNGSFELGGPLSATNWAAGNGDQASRATITDAPDGAHVLLFSHLQGPVRSIPFAPKAGDLVTVKAVARDAGSAVQIGVEFYRAGILIDTQALGPRAPAIAWEPIEVVALTPNGATKARVVFLGTPATNSLVDAVNVTISS